MSMDAFQRLAAWLTHNGYEIQKRAGQTFVRVARKKHGPLKLHLRLTAAGWVARGDRKSHRCRTLEKLIVEFNDAERIVSGVDGDRLDARIQKTLDGLPDSEVQQMADYYRDEPPLTLADVRRAGVSRHLPDYVAFPDLPSLVSAMRYREAWMAEPSKRDALMAKAG